jgi:hypothetical protein
MKFSFGSIFLILYGLSSLIAGILNKDILFWNIRPITSFSKRWLEKEDWRYLNIVFGSLAIALGIFIIIFRK